MNLDPILLSVTGWIKIVSVYWAIYQHVLPDITGKKEKRLNTVRMDLRCLIPFVDYTGKYRSTCIGLTSVWFLDSNNIKTNHFLFFLTKFLRSACSPSHITNLNWLTSWREFLGLSWTCKLRVGLAHKACAKMDMGRINLCSLTPTCSGAISMSGT